ncbi:MULTISPECIES: Csu type fimbrial protein [Acinetobacter Taxon 24]|jgi:spore coat protein U-like protein|uniref:Spore coat U domain-containing protein n=2 Tax=Acinetobacter Taxon 24 TaxID=2839056 RepID=A0AAW6UYP1_9GAMM|nr:MULTISPECIES: spore coat U domain-containing protein [Acinetobacter Taxon 24]MDK1685189.1 spore coat U domain-containing protein [Acinetobacter terrestris]TCB58394.1 SCPU domain-containing protein [Acinetobacter terrae]
MRIKKQKNHDYLFSSKFAFKIVFGLCLVGIYSNSNAAECSISSLSLDFGEVSTATVSATSNVTVTCSPPNGKTNYTICLTADSWAYGNSSRYLYYSSFLGLILTESLKYDLFYDPARTKLIKSKNETGSLQCSNFTVSGNEKLITQIPVYGLVYSGQQPTMGQYKSSLTLSLELLYASNKGGNIYPTMNEVLTSGKMVSNRAVVTANYENSCVLHNATDVVFGNFDNLNSDKTASAQISLQCPNRTTWKVSLNQGKYALGNSQRRMSNGRDYINYELYSDSSLSRVWGTTLDSMVQANGTNQVQTINVYGKVPKQNFQSAGDYQDTITVTLTY